jgi:hypothetical protein
VERGTDGLGVALGRDHHDGDGAAAGPQPLQDLQAADVGQVDVQQDEVRCEVGATVQRLGPRAGRPHDLETGRALDEPGMDAGHHEVVVDDEDADHVSSRGSRTVKTAPSSCVTVTVPCRWVVMSRTSGSPMPRPPGTSGLLE